MLVQEGNLAHASFPHWWDDVVQDAFALVLMKEGKLACVIVFLRWNHVVRDVLVLVQEGKLTCAIFPPWWDDVVRDELVFAIREI